MGEKPFLAASSSISTPSWAWVSFHGQLVAAIPKQSWPVPTPPPFLTGPLTAVRTSQLIMPRPPPQTHPREMPKACARLAGTPARRQPAEHSLEVAKSSQGQPPGPRLCFQGQL